MKTFKTLILLGTLLLLLIPARGHAVQMLYGITWDEKLITIDTSTGLGTLVGSLDTSMFSFGLATRSGKLYAFDQIADRIRELDPSTAYTLNTINIGVSTVGEGGLTFRSDGIGFMSRSSGGTGILWSFDITVPSSTPITSDGGLNPSMDGLDFNSNDILYGLSQDDNKLYIINQTTGATVLVGDPGVIDNDHVSGLAFRSDNVLFAELSGSLYKINSSNGQATLIGGIGYSVSGLTFLGEKPAEVPEPMTMILLGSGLAGVGLYRRLRKPRG